MSRPVLVIFLILTSEFLKAVLKAAVFFCILHTLIAFFGDGDDEEPVEDTFLIFEAQPGNKQQGKFNSS